MLNRLGMYDLTKTQRTLNLVRYRLRHYRRWLSIRPRIFWVAKWDTALGYGGPEEGGWWYDSGVPVWRYSIPVPLFEELSYVLCRWLNGKEKDRQEREEEYGYTSVLSYRSTHYSYGHSDTFKPQPYPSHRPHYE